MRDTKAVAVRQGPAATLEVLFRAEYTGMVRMAFTLIGNNAEAEEVVQDSSWRSRNASTSWINPAPTCAPSW